MEWTSLSDEQLKELAYSTNHPFGWHTWQRRRALSEIRRRKDLEVLEWESRGGC
jgi:hypothetical protein